MGGIGRLRDGETLAAVRADVQMIHARVAKHYTKLEPHFGVRVEPLQDAVIGDAGPFLFAIFAAVTGVLLVACANVANLLLSRGATRDREFAVRVANGASRRRIIAQLLAESFVFAASGGLCGLGLAYAGVTGFVASAPQLPRLDAITFDESTALYTLLAVAFCTFAAGLAPAFALSSRQVAIALKAAGRGGDASRGARARAGLMVVEIALTFALVVASSLVVRSFWILTHEPLGFSPQNVIVSDNIDDSLESAMGQSSSSRRVFRGFYERLAARMQAIPGVRAVSLAISAPFMERMPELRFTFADHPMPDTEKPRAEFAAVGPSYFALLRVPLLKGRSFTNRDRADALGVVIVNEVFAREYRPHGPVIGTRIAGIPTGGNGKRPPATIVGVVGDVRGTYALAPQPTIYMPFEQAPVLPAIALVRTVPGVHVASSVAAEVPATNPLLPAPQMRDLTSYMSDDAARARLAAITLGTLGLLGLTLAVAGIYAVVSYGVAQRTHELGVRMALGARARHIVQRVIAGTLGLTIIGVLCGIVVGAFAVRLVADELYGIKPYDPLTFGLVILMITLASIVAALLPARRATHVEPIVALRYE
ncbi:MAG: FtsX-like permease family protein [Candidatus Eremiobacteraeota bacterium]|nr:FtsX-like permease family protein [Candidatus Eremiobacteraeota bacterium]MBC5804291.1 FtsX-like permease family protein [Candidatus Eremiobacteraeota bacterium]MBC5822054.1 FtsX-like permease family protein [Candidatus Eremiobacteraeota bacterium]